jgi:hypothetical protein
LNVSKSSNKWVCGFVALGIGLTLGYHVWSTEISHGLSCSLVFTLHLRTFPFIRVRIALTGKSGKSPMTLCVMWMYSSPSQCAIVTPVAPEALDSLHWAVRKMPSPVLTSKSLTAVASKSPSPTLAPPEEEIVTAVAITVLVVLGLAQDSLYLALEAIW